MPTPLLRQLIGSLRREPERWRFGSNQLERDDGIMIRVSPGYSGRTRRLRLVSPREVPFSWLESWMLRRALRAWEHRPIGERHPVA